MPAELRELPAERIGAAGKRLRESGIREKFGITVLNVQRSSGEGIFNPGPDTILLEGDILQVLGLPDELDKIGAVPAGVS